MPKKPLDGAVLEDAADRFVRYGIAGLAAQGELGQGEAGRVLLRAALRFFGIDAPREVQVAIEANEEVAS